MSIRYNSTVRDIMTDSVYHAAGIINTDGAAQKDVNRILASLPPAEALKMKRKFRKLWRRAAKRELTTSKNASTYMLKKSKSGLGEPQPTKKQKSHRKMIVSMEMYRAVNQLLDTAEANLTGGTVSL